MSHTRLSTGWLDLNRRDEAAASGLSETVLRAADEWQLANGEIARRYQSRWVPEPARQWSRQWEYPFVLSQVIAETAEQMRVLDVGAGFTFFPSLVARANPHREVIATDVVDLRHLYEQQQPRVPNLSFSRQDAMALDLADSSIDIAYSVSTLEHLPDPSRAVSELARVVRPGGLLVLTFDVSVDGRSDIPVPALHRLLEPLAGEFDGPRPNEIPPEALTTAWFAKAAPESLPWPYPRLSGVKQALHRRKLPIPRMPQLACYGAAWRKNML